MLYGLLVSLWVINTLLLVLLILIQQGKGSMGLGAMGGGSQMLFGGSGGQDVFQKATWVMGTIFMAGSLILAMMKSDRTGIGLRYVRKTPAAQRVPAPAAKPIPSPPSSPAQK